MHACSQIFREIWSNRELVKYMEENQSIGSKSFETRKLFYGKTFVFYRRKKTENIFCDIRSFSATLRHHNL